MKAKSIILKKELSFFKAKKQKLGQHKGKNTTITKKNLEPPKKKTLESSMEPIEKREYFLLKALRVKRLHLHSNLAQQKTVKNIITH